MSSLNKPSDVAKQIDVLSVPHSVSRSCAVTMELSIIDHLA
jgi:hypothetical protein